MSTARFNRGTSANRGQFASHRQETCLMPGECTPQDPKCARCIAGRELYLEDVPDGDWAKLEGWQRDGWREGAGVDG